jgi:hypothetical protein
MGEKGANRRHAERRVPRRSVGIEAEAEGLDSVAGEARNLSTGGACVSLAADLAVGEDVILRLHFPTLAYSVPATGRVVWTSTRLLGRPRYGIQWTHPGSRGYWLDWLSRS